MYQIANKDLSHKALTALKGIRDKIDLLASGEVQSLHYFAHHFTSGGASFLTVQRSSDEYSVLNKGIFSNPNNQIIGNAASSLAFLDDFNVTQAGIIIEGPVLHRKSEFLATSPERLLGFITMMAVQLEDMFPPSETIL